MREIKFRGKNIDNGEWVYGHLLHDEEQGESYIAEYFEDRSAYIRPVIPETVGQFTGLFDKNGKEIYEGDVVLAECNATMETKRQIKIHKCKVIYSLDFHRWSFPIIDMKLEGGATSRATSYFRFGYQGNAMEVISNIHEQEE